MPSCGCLIGPELGPGTRRVDMEAPGWAVVGYSRAQAVADRAVLPVTFGALDGEATWAERSVGSVGDDERITVGPHRLAGLPPDRDDTACSLHGSADRLCDRAAAQGFRGDA